MRTILPFCLSFFSYLLLLCLLLNSFFLEHIFCRGESAGYLALRSIAAFFRISSDPNPSPTDPISVSRAEFEAALDEMAEAEVPLKADRDQAWRDFAGWRVNYDFVLLALAELMIAPAARWSSDRRL